MNLYDNRPPPFFELVIHAIDRKPGLSALSAGYEASKWRHDEFANYLFDWLPEFALKYSELEDFNSATAMRLLKRAAKTVFTTPKYKKRGEFGELLLHALIREIFASEPALSKIYYKSATNETVKGFDAVHIVENEGRLELWLGEVKFYKDISAAIRDVITELSSHTQHDYLRNEFICIESKIDRRWKHAAALRQLIDSRTSLDSVFERVCLPVLLTYESECVGAHSKISEEFYSQFKAEIEHIYSTFAANELPPLSVHLFLVPIHDKDTLVSCLQSKLEGLQR